MKRRDLILNGILAGAYLSGGRAWALEDSDIQIVGEIPPLPDDLKDKSKESPSEYHEVSAVGTGKPLDTEVKAAYDILLASPFGVPPVDVAQYFLAVGAGAYGSENKQFAREWPVRANPLIFHFFSSTQTKPEGDTTAWCAAFINWCILRSHATSREEIGKSPGSFSMSGKLFPSENLKRYSTNNASSGSFRCWKETESPNRGDIVVLKNPGTDGLSSSCRGSGHVTFFLTHLGGNRIQTLGGNQSLAGSNGAVTIANVNIGSGSRFMKYVTLKAG